jgi:3-oxoadipate enol-lactonase
VELGYRLEGDASGPVLVLASSLGTTRAMWEPQLPALTGRRRVLRYDHPGHGSSPVGPTSIAGFGRAVLELLDGLGLHRVAFCGLSLGGIVAMWLGANAAERVERLVLCCTAPHLPPREMWQERADTVRAEGVEAIADVVVGRWFTPDFADAHPDVVRRYRAMLVDTPAEGYARGCEAVRDADLRAELTRIEAPTTLVFGKHDPVVSEEQRGELRRIRGARIVEVEAAHLANVEQPDAFADVLLSSG